MEITSLTSPRVRRHERTHLDVYVNKIIGDEPHLARVRDISMTGVYLYKLLEPELTTGQIGLEIKLPHTDDVIWAVGEIVRQDAGHHGEGVAVRFVRIAEHDRELIRRYVDAQREGELEALAAAA